MATVVLDDDAPYGPIKIEIADARPGGDVSDVYAEETTRDVRDKVVRLSRNLFGEAVDLARSCAVQVKEKIDDMPEVTRPDEFEVQFGMNLSATAGASIAGSSAGAQLQVSLRWKNGPDA
jgi:hypothetical protein